METYLAVLGGRRGSDSDEFLCQEVSNFIGLAVAC